MSWLPLTDEDASALDIHEAQDGRGLVSQSRETLESRLLDAEARLATERESHCQTKEALQALTRESRDVSHQVRSSSCSLSGCPRPRAGSVKARAHRLLVVYGSPRRPKTQLFEANAQLAAAQEALKARSDELKVQNTLRENLETALRHAQERFEGGSAASSSTRRPRTRSQDKDLQQCEACSSKDQELRDTTARLLLLETQHAQLATQKATLESAHVHLANQLAALEKVAERKQDALRSDNDALKDEINDLKDANRDLVADSERRTRDHVQAIRSAEAGREQVANQSEAAQKALHDAQVNLEARTEELQALREEHEVSRLLRATRLARSLRMRRFDLTTSASLRSPSKANPMQTCSASRTRFKFLKRISSPQTRIFSRPEPPSITRGPNSTRSKRFSTRCPRDPSTTPT